MDQSSTSEFPTPCCKVAARPDAADIDAALRDGADGDPNGSVRRVAARFGLPPTAIQRHRKHLFRDDESDGGTTGNSGESAGTRSRVRIPAEGPLSGVPRPGDDEPTSPRRLLTAAIEEKCVDLRIAGKTYKQISDQLEIDDETAMDAVERVLVRTLGRADRKAEQAREVEIRRCEAIIAAQWDTATGSSVDPDVRGRAADRVLRASERKAKLLGLDAVTGAAQMPFYLGQGFDEFLGIMLAPLQDHPEQLQLVLDAAKGHIAMLATQKPVRPGLRVISGGRSA